MAKYPSITIKAPGMNRYRPVMTVGGVICKVAVHRNPSVTLGRFTHIQKIASFPKGCRGNLRCSGILHSVQWSLPTFWDNLSVPSSKVKKFKKKSFHSKNGFLSGFLDCRRWNRAVVLKHRSGFTPVRYVKSKKKSDLYKKRATQQRNMRQVTDFRIWPK